MKEKFKNNEDYMSDEISKEKHSKRRQKDTNAIKKQIKIVKAHNNYSNSGPDLNKELQEPHRLAKHHGTNCGQPKCIMCGNPRKVWGEETVQEKKFKQEKLHVISEPEDHDYNEQK